MKKILYMFAMLLPLTISAADVQAKHAENKPASTQQISKETQKIEKNHKNKEKNKKHTNKDKKDKNKKEHQNQEEQNTKSNRSIQQQTLNCEISRVDRAYHNTLEEIAQSPLSQPARTLLTKQAAENRDFLVSQLRARAELCAKQTSERSPFADEIAAYRKQSKS